MEKWKVAAIVSLLLSLGLYGVIQARYPQGVGTFPGAPTPTPPPIPALALKGTQALDWSFPLNQWTNTTRPLTLKDVHGSVTLLEFWRTGCPHCRDAAPFMEGLYTKYGPQGLKVVTFQSPTPYDTASDDENNWMAVKEFIKDNKLTYPTAFDVNGKLFNKYKGSNYPTIIVLDRNGKIILVQTGHTPEKAQELEKTIQDELKKK